MEKLWWLYRKLLNGSDLIIGNEKHFKLPRNDVVENRCFYSTDPVTAPPQVNFQCKTKFEPEMMIWMAMFSKVLLIAMFTKVNEMLIKKHAWKDVSIKDYCSKYHSNGNYLFWPDLTKAHYSNIVQERLTPWSLPFVSRVDNPPNIPQARLIDTVWTVVKRKIYENNWEAKNIDHLVQRIKQKAKEFEQEMLQSMMKGVLKKVRAMWRGGLYLIF